MSDGVSSDGISWKWWVCGYTGLILDIMENVPYSTIPRHVPEAHYVDYLTGYNACAAGVMYLSDVNESLETILSDTHELKRRIHDA